MKPQCSLGAVHRLCGGDATPVVARLRPCRPVMHDDVVAKEELGGLDINSERLVERLQLSIGRGGKGVDHVSVVHIHHEVHTGTIGQVLPEIAPLVGFNLHFGVHEPKEM